MTSASPQLTASDAPPQASAFLADMQQALGQRPRAISPKYFYDAPGSALFEQICELPEYYPTRTELAILSRYAADMAGLIGPNAEIVEFGAGSLHKVRLLLDALPSARRYVPIDISGEHLAHSVQALRQDYPQLQVQPLVADYTQRLLLGATPEGCGQRVGFFPGSTVGNFTPEETLRFFRMAAGVLRGGALLLGVDLVKSPDVLHAAYNDAQGVTAAFNLNLLSRANRELGADFVLAQYAHSAFYNAPLRRIEMHLVSRARQRVTLGEHSYLFEEGETLHTENSYKYTIDGLRALALEAGFRPGPVWCDAQQWFGLHWLQAPQT